MFRILFDNGIHRLYVSKELYERLKLKTIRREYTIIKTFDQLNISSFKKLDIVQHKNVNLHVFVEAHCMPFIYSPVQKQEISRACKNFSHISKFILTDFDDGS